MMSFENFQYINMAGGWVVVKGREGNEAEKERRAWKAT